MSKALDLVHIVHKLLKIQRCIIFVSAYPSIHNAGFAVMISNISLRTDLVNYCVIQKHNEVTEVTRIVWV